MKRLLLFFVSIFLFCGVCYAQMSFDVRYKNAETLYKAGQYDKAILVLQAALKTPGITAEQTKKANGYIAKCRSARNKPRAPKKEAPEEATFTVIVNPSPEDAQISIDDNGYVDARTFLLPKGSHSVKVSREHYMDWAETVTVNPEDTLKVLTLNANLVPAYASLICNIRSVSGINMKSKPRILVDGFEVADSTSVAIKESERFEFLTMYAGGRLFVTPGLHTLKVTAEGFFPAEYNILLNPGEIRDFSPSLSAMQGLLEIQAPEACNGSTVYIDDEEAGVLPLEAIPLERGRHIVRVEKDGFVSVKPYYTVDIKNGETCTLEPSLKEVSVYVFTSDPDSCDVFINNNYVGKTPYKAALDFGPHYVEISRKGWKPRRVVVRSDGTPGRHDHKITLTRVYPVSIECEEEGLDVEISNKNWETMSGITAPSVVELPLLRSPYMVKVKDQKGRVVLKRRFKFDRGSYNHLQIKPYVKIPALLAVSVSVPEFINAFDQDYTQFIGVSLFRFKVFPGFSTDLVNSKLYFGKERGQANPFIYAISPAFLNGQFRVGTEALKNIDFCLLASYGFNLLVTNTVAQFFGLSGTWPELDSTDLFLGVELSTSRPVFNVSFKAGGLFTKNRGVRFPTAGDLTVSPGESLGLAVSLELELGTKKSRGQNMLRF